MGEEFNNYGTPTNQSQGGAGLAIASMVLGIVAVVFLCCAPYVAVLCAIVGAVLGGVALAKKTAGKGMAIAGLVCSIVALVPAIYLIACGASVLASLGLL